MADKLYVEIGADIKALQKSLADATKELKEFRNDTEKSFDNAADATKKMQAQLNNSRKAVGMLNKYTKGLGEGWLQVAKAAKVGGAAMKSALIASGVGALLVILGEIVAHWDDIAGWITGSTERIRLQKIELDKITETLKEHKKLRSEYSTALSQSLALVTAEAKAQGKSVSDIEAIQKKHIKNSIDRYYEMQIAQEKINNQLLIDRESAEKESLDDINKALAAGIAEAESLKAAGVAAGNALTLHEQGVKLRAYEEELKAFKKLQKEKLAALSAYYAHAAKSGQFNPFQDLGDAPSGDAGGFGDGLSSKKEERSYQDRMAAIARYDAYLAEATPEIRQKMIDMIPDPGLMTEKQEQVINGMLDTAMTMKDIMTSMNEDMSNLIVGSIADTFSQLGTVIGEALATGENVFQAMGQSLLASLSTFLSEMGDLLIYYGTLAVAKGAIDEAIEKGGKAAIIAGVAGIAVGIALKAVSGAIGAKASAGAGSGSSSGSSVSSGGSSSYSGSSVRSSSGGSSSGTYVFEIAGTKLIGVLKNTLDRNKALGGSSLSFS